MPHSEHIPKGSHFAEFHVRANQPITLKFMDGGDVYNCAVNVFFVPETGTDYEVLFTGDKLTRNCTVEIPAVAGYAVVRAAEGRENRAGVLNAKQRVTANDAR